MTKPNESKPRKPVSEMTSAEFQKTRRDAVLDLSPTDYAQARREAIRGNPTNTARDARDLAAAQARFATKPPEKGNK